MSPKPKPKASNAPTETPRTAAAPSPAAAPPAVPPHTREEGRQHPWEPEEQKDGGRADATPPAPASGRPGEPAPGRASARPRARTRGTRPDLEQWGRMVSVAALKVGAARRKVDSREEELARVVAQARAAGASEEILSAWLISAGLTPEER